MSETIMNELTNSRKKHPNLPIGQHFLSSNKLDRATVLLEAGGKPSTRFPPGGLAEPTSPPEYHTEIKNGIQKNMNFFKKK